MVTFFEKVEKAKPVYDVVYKVFMLICKLLLIADIGITSWVVLARYITIIPAPAWGEEIILTLMSYMAVLSASLAIRRNAHIRMTAFDRYLPKKMINVLDLIADVCVLFLAIVMLVIGGQFAITIGQKASYISLPNLSKFWMYFPIPLAGFAMIFFELERVLIDIAAFFGVTIKTGLEEAPIGANNEALKEEEAREAAAKAQKKEGK